MLSIMNMNTASFNFSTHTPISTHTLICRHTHNFIPTYIHLQAVQFSKPHGYSILHSFEYSL